MNYSASIIKMGATQSATGSAWLWPILYAVLIVRSSLDPALELTRSTGGGFSAGVGALFNLTILVACLTAITLRLTEVPLKAFFFGPLFIAYGVLMTLSATHFVDSLRTLLNITTYFCLFFAPFLLIKQRSDLQKFLNLIVASSVVPALWALRQLVVFGADERVTGTFTHANIFAFYILVVLTAVLCSVSSKEFKISVFRRLLLFSFAVLLAVLLIYTKTRSAWLGAGILLFLYALFVNKRAIPIILVSIPLAFLSPEVQSRLFDLQSEVSYVGNGIVMNSFQWRQSVWISSLPWIEQSPIFGHGGFGSFKRLSPEFFKWASSKEGVDAHNIYIELLFEIGLIGLLLFVGFFLQLFRNLARGIKQDSVVSLLGVFLALTYLVISASDNVLAYLSFNWYFWLLSGAISARVAIVKSTAWTESFNTLKRRSRLARPTRRLLKSA